jgi:branched-subunit amino acid aminotransferase/4-amino-4-deoxychorismate lyase
VIALELARAAGADEAIRLDPTGRAIEGATCNLFAVHHGAVSTPAVDGGALPGIVRARVLEICAREGLATRVRPLSLRELRGAREVFVTSSLRGVVPVTRIDGAPVGSGAITERISVAYAAAMRTAT